MQNLLHLGLYHFEIGMGTTNVAIMTSKGAPVYNIGVMHYEDWYLKFKFVQKCFLSTCLGCICGEHSRKVTVTDQTTGEVLVFVLCSSRLTYS